MTPRRSRAVAAILVLLLSAFVWGVVGPSPAVGIPSSDGGTPVGAGHEPVGCASRPGAKVAHGSRLRDVVALTFDDGPSLTETPEILTILNRLQVQATFFVQGRHIAGREGLLRRMIASGNEIGNHSFDHPRYPDYRELAETNRRIRAATGFEPCLFRPPYGLVDPRVTAAARRARLQTVFWSLDSHDDRHPSVAAIRATVVSRAQPGSIILMHDGGHHPQTIRALPGAIRALRARGFQFATVTELLGGRMLYRPAG